MSYRGFIPGDQHPEEYRADLNPNPLAGQNTMAADQQEKNAPTAYDVKDVHRQFSGFTDDELKQIPVLSTGMRLEQGATYVDLQDEQLKEFTARGDMQAEEGHYYVPKSQVDYEVWNRLIGIDNPVRTNEPNGK